MINMAEKTKFIRACRVLSMSINTLRLIVQTTRCTKNPLIFSTIESVS